MTRSTDRMRDQARQKANKAFHTWESRTQLVKTELAAASAANDAKTARLRALRLEKEQREAEAAALAPAPAASTPPKPKAKPIKRIVAG
jgi:hypothetical protein